MKPLQIVFFFLSVLIILLAISLYWPQNDIQISKKITLKFPGYNDLINNQVKTQYDVGKILSDLPQVNDSVLLDTNSVIIEDNSEIKKEFSGSQAFQPLDLDQLRLKYYPLEYQGDDISVYFSEFFAKLDKAKKGSSKVRIMHYGDSQIEGDRMSSVLREKFQTRFGGGGVGLLSLVQPYNFHMSVKRKNDGEWIRKTGYGRIDTLINHKRYGPLMSFSEFSTKSVTGNAKVLFSKSVYAGKKAFQFNEVHLYYSHNSAPFYYEISMNDNLLDADILGVTNSLKRKTWTLDQFPNSIGFFFEGSKSPQFYAVSFESTTGVIFDNIGLRGSSGIIFTKTDKKILTDALKLLEPDLIILQFGGNALSYVNKDNYKIFQQWYVDQLKFLKKHCGKIPFIIIGSADVSLNHKGYYVTDPDLKYLNLAVKNAAFETGTVFWDLFEAMGGENSMPAWVFSDPPLASSDFIHFSPTGIKIVAEIFYNSLMQLYSAKTENK